MSPLLPAMRRALSDILRRPMAGKRLLMSVKVSTIPSMTLSTVRQGMMRARSGALSCSHTPVRQRQYRGNRLPVFASARSSAASAPTLFTRRMSFCGGALRWFDGIRAGFPLSEDSP